MHKDFNIEKYNKKIKLYFTNKNLTNEDIEDLTQETICRIYESLNRFSYRSSISTWIYAICKNVYYEYIRKSKTIEELNVESVFIDDETSRIEINILLERLPKRLKLIYDKRYQLGMTIKEISRELNIPQGTVKYYIYEIKKFLKLKYEA